VRIFAVRREPGTYSAIEPTKAAIAWCSFSDSNTEPFGAQLERGWQGSRDIRFPFAALFGRFQSIMLIEKLRMLAMLQVSFYCRSTLEGAGWGRQ
jgi:hypothetical protein